MDRLLISIAMVLLLLQSYGLVTNVDIYALLQGESTAQERPNVGFLIETREKVKRKGPDSIVWEDSQGDDQLHAYDSVLTLDDSSARLRLTNDTTIDLHENTLIVLEPEDNLEKNAPTTFRVRFSRGNLLTKNPDRRLDVSVEEWTVQAEAGSKMTLKTLQEGQFEIEMHSGQAAIKKIQNNSGENALLVKAGTRAQLAENSSPQFLKLSEDLHFKEVSPLRIYTHSEMVKQTIEWEGEATSMRIILPDQMLTELPLLKSQRSVELPFRKGNHYLSLMHEKSSSKEIQVDIRSAPKIRYIRPLFRDRLPFDNESTFSWFPVSIAQSYVVHIGDDIQIPATGNHLLWRTSLSGSLQFSVWGVDADGFFIPPDYTVPIFGAQDPFQAPQLRSPAREKKKNTTPPKKKDNFSIWNWIFPKVYAQEDTFESIDPKNPTVTFNWYPVEGADYYIIEISSVSDFSFPEVMTKVREQKFVWHDYKKRSYYWRVAAGSDSGRMGLFSEPMQVDLTKAHLYPSGEIAKGVWVEQTENKNDVTEKQTNEPKPLAEPNVKPLLEAAAQKIMPQLVDWQKKSRFMLNIHHQTSNFEDDFSAALSGFAPVNFTFEHWRQKDEDRTWLAHFRWTQMDWEPKNEVSLPYQNSFSTEGAKTYVLTKDSKQEFFYGWTVDHIFTFQRTDDEQVDIELKYVTGPIISLGITATNEIQLQLVGGIVTDTDYYGLWSANKIRYQEKSRFFVGGDLDFTIFFGPESTSGFNSSAGFHLGFEW